MKRLVLLAFAAQSVLQATAVHGDGQWTTAATHASSTKLEISPETRPDGERWRIGYVQSGDYAEYPRTLAAIVLGLQQLGWLQIDAIPLDLDGPTTWTYIATHAHSDTLEFVQDAYWQPGNFDASARSSTRESMNSRLAGSSDIDLMIAMGTWAGQDAASLGPPVPTVVASVSDPIRAGIVVSAEDSGRDNLHARVQADHYERQLFLFHDIVAFHSLGVVYEDTAEGRGYAALDSLEKVAKARQFLVVPCRARTSGISVQAAELNVLTCYKRLAASVEAMYVTASAGLTAESTRHIATLLQKSRTPSFAMLGAGYVRNGLLMSMVNADYATVGRFHAEAIARIFHGEQPRRISQRWSGSDRIAINFKTMRLLGFDPPMDILIAADDVFDEEDSPERLIGEAAGAR